VTGIPALLATTNRGKLRELSGLFAGSPLSLFLPSDEGVPMPAVEETEDTFAGNAALKARALSASSGRWALADDSGLEVAALGGAPGVKSARYSDPGADDTRNIAKLLREMEGRADRKARFVCVLALSAPDGKLVLAEGALEGVIAEAPRGTNGFGYDPVFVVPSLGRTVAELSLEEKQSISHRSNAARRLLHLLSQ
jgi:XTP/dITP diphosphohydrolase